MKNFNLKKHKLVLCEEDLKKKYLATTDYKTIEEFIEDKVYAVVWDQIASREEKHILRRNVDIEHNEELGEYILTFYYSLKE